MTSMMNALKWIGVAALLIFVGWFGHAVGLY